MPKLPGGISKVQRVQAVRTVMGRWGRLDKAAIDTHVAALLDSAPEEIGRSLYRDLEELERNGELLAFRFSRDGRPLEDYDPDIHKNTYCEWAMPGGSEGVLGAKRLEENNIAFQPAARLIHSLKITDGKPTSSENLTLYFRGATLAYGLELARDALPAQFLLSRVSETLPKTALIRHLENHFGKRASLLQLPVANLSAIKETQLGHLLIRAEAPGAISLRDLQSKNGSFYRELTEDQARSLVLEAATRSEATSSDTLHTERAELAVTRLGAGEEKALKLPVLIRASHLFELIAI